VKTFRGPITEGAFGRRLTVYGKATAPQYHNKALLSQAKPNQGRVFWDLWKADEARYRRVG